MNEIAPSIETSVRTEAPSIGKPFEPAPVSGNFAASPLLMDVKLPIRVRMGGTKLSLRAITQLTNGSVVELDCSVNHPVDMVVNDRVIAQGEIVIVGGNYGVRITEFAGGTQAETQLGTEHALRNLSDQLK